MPPGEDPELGQPKITRQIGNSGALPCLKIGLLKTNQRLSSSRFADPPKIPIFISKVRSTLAAASARLAALTRQSLGNLIRTEKLSFGLKWVDFPPLDSL